jgi:diaminopimelate decarboxylase
VHGDDRPLVPCDVVGPVCESSDTFGRSRQLPIPRVGDLMAIMDAGAYGAVMSNSYNRRPLPPEVLADDPVHRSPGGGGEGRWRVLRRRQTIDDMLALEDQA